MKKVLVMMSGMFLGGAERSLLGLLESFDTTEYEVDLFLFRHEGELLSLVPDRIHLLDEQPAWTTFDRPIKDVLKSSLWPCALARIISKAHNKIRRGSGVWKSMQYTAYYLTPLLPRIPGHYDMAISFLGIPFYMRKVDADIKLAWIHTDYDQLDPDVKMDLKAFEEVDYIVNVSEQCEEVFLKHYPELKNKSMMIENILPVESTIWQSEMDISAEMPQNDCFRLLSIGRFSSPKNFDNVPDICARIRSMGISVKWYIIGFGGDEALIQQKIREANMEEYVILLGKKDNPYPYIRACDLYVQPSRYEGKCVAVREAQMLGKPVVITNYATSASQLEEGVDGVVVPMDNQGCAEGIATVLQNNALMKQLSKTCAERDYSNGQEVKKIYELMQ